MRRVVKIGGSLLSRQTIVADVRRWLSATHDLDRRQSHAAVETLVVVGGGGVIDAIRDLDRLHSLDPSFVHWLCVDLLQASYQICRQWFPEWSAITDRTEFAVAQQQGFATHAPTLIAPAAFYHRDSDATLPLSWNTTTDSIAAYLAITVAADELVLLKSCPIEPSTSIAQLAADGVVDEALRALAAQCPCVRVTTLRSQLAPQ